MPSRMLRNVVDTYSELLRLHQLNLELLETLELALHFLKDLQEKHNIHIPNRDKIESMLKKAEILINEISIMPSDENSQRKPSDKDYTESENPTH